MRTLHGTRLAGAALRMLPGQHFGRAPVRGLAPSAPASAIATVAACAVAACTLTACAVAASTLTACSGHTPNSAILDAPAGAVGAARGGRTAPLPFGPAERRAELTFVRDALRDSYAHLDLKERQWGAHLDERYERHLGPIERAESWPEYARVLEAFLGGFHDGHLRWSPPPRSLPEPEHRARFGFETRLVGGRLLVSEVWPLSDARRAGLRVGDEIVAVEGRTVPHLFARSQELETWSRSERARYLFERRWSTLPFQDEPRLHPRRVTLRRADGGYETLRVGPEMDAYYRLRDAPIELHELETQYRLDVTTLMLRRAEVTALMTAVRARLAARPLPLLIDLRGNPGGYDNAARVVAGSFSARAVRGATVRMRLSEPVLEHRPAWRDLPRDPHAPGWSLPQPFTAEGLAPSDYPAPIAVLIDAGCISSCETLALLLRARGARLFGTRSGGSSGGPIQIDLPHSGGRLSVPVWAIEDLEGLPLEGRGVVPDVLLEASADDLVAGTDVVLQRSMAWLRTATAGLDDRRPGRTALRPAPDPRKLVAGSETPPPRNAPPGPPIQGTPCNPPSCSSTSTAR